MSAPFNDEPTLTDLLQRSGWVLWFRDNIRKCEPPYVFSIHGDWGSGKTSFLHQLYGCFTGCRPNGDTLPPQILKLWGKTWNPSKDHVVIWFEAWRYQQEAMPIVALLHELRAQCLWYRKTFEWFKKITEVTIRGALSMFDEATGTIGETATARPSPGKIQAIGENWEGDHFRTSLPTQKLRKHLSDSIQELIGKDRRLVVLIDDLDRCLPEAAYRLLEGMKIYLNLPNCIFVLAVDQRQLQRSVAQCLPGNELETAGNFSSTIQNAREYLEKICQDVWQLPLIPMGAHEEFLKSCLKDQLPDHEQVVQEVCDVLRSKPYLPANARKLKAYANALRNFVEHCKPVAGWNAAKHARMIVIMSCLYQFHTDLYRVLEGTPAFYNEIIEWLEGRTANRVFANIEVAGNLLKRGSSPGSSGGGGDSGSFVSFPDPAIGNVFRIRALVDEQGTVTEDEVRNYLLPYARP